MLKLLQIWHVNKTCPDLSLSIEIKFVSHKVFSMIESIFY